MNNNVADGQLLDVRKLSLDDLAVTDDAAPTGLDRALHRILSSSGECNFNSFNSSI